MQPSDTPGTILLAGASRGLGLGLAHEYLARGWNVIATARAPEHARELAALGATSGGKLTIEQLDVADPASVRALAARLSGHRLNVLFVVAGISGHSAAPIHEVPHAAIAHEFVTNATSPIALAEALQPSLAPAATVAFMTSILGSIGSNAGGGMELYRATKSALNMLASCYALRHKGTPVLLLHPGWVRTELGGAAAPLDVETSVRGLADVIAAHGARAGIAYLDYAGHKLPW
jgi:NAD(P)-dependent dehydrogenase (short-subunit alcohol dehydrogenase family)